MERAPYRKNTREFRLEAIRLVPEGGLSAGEAEMRWSLPKSALENRLRAFKAGKQKGVGKSHRPLTDVKRDLAWVKREAVPVRMERDILNKTASSFARKSQHGTR